ncbi:MAG: GatB/YqeY domain-containing protein [Chloroflexi bacterium]|nr:GatB/YqeY domain-containing protein [Chloroflexota bacterium]
MSLRDQIQADLKAAMKAREKEKVGVLRVLNSAFKEAEQSKREDLVNKAIKKHGVKKPSSSSEEDMQAYQQALDEAFAAEGVDEAAVLSDDDLLSVIMRLVKQRQDSIQEAQDVGREDVAATEQFELDVLQAYLPEQLSREEVEAIAQEIIAQTGASGPKDMGKVMGPLMGRLKGQADGKLVNEVVRDLLKG